MDRKRTTSKLWRKMGSSRREEALRTLVEIMPAINVSRTCFSNVSANTAAARPGLVLPALDPDYSSRGGRGRVASTESPELDQLFDPGQPLGVLERHGQPLLDLCLNTARLGPVSFPSVQLDTHAPHPHRTART